MLKKLLLSDKELASALGEKIRTIHTWRRAGILPYVKLGYRTLRYNQDACEAALLRREVKAGRIR
jgi:predicted site-specific integrase-resolvase